MPKVIDSFYFDQPWEAFRTAKRLQGKYATRLRLDKRRGVWLDILKENRSARTALRALEAVRNATIQPEINIRSLSSAKDS